MKKSVFYFTFFCLFGQVSAQQTPNSQWEKYLKPLPKEAAQVIIKILKCNSFGGAELSKKEMVQWKKLQCDSAPKDAESLRAKFSSNLKVIDALNCVQSSASAKDDCPEVQL